MSVDGIVERHGFKTEYVDLGRGNGARGEIVATISLETPAGARPEIGPAGAVSTIGAIGKAVLCPAGATTVLKTTSNGAAGDVLTRLIFLVTDNSTATVTLKDGDGTVYSDGAPNPFNNLLIRPANSPVYEMNFGGQPSYNGAWSITCGAGVAVLAQGIFDNNI